ncbi:GNAT family N-acetyltransferase [Wukongibacter baidiensis]|uniref:GNAT family N-acetyltransferase n=1 Tax=Wukongibacter baidiensis TaxID=1723361 RepID=UPI003D7F63DC
MKIYPFTDLKEEQTKELYDFIMSFGSNSYFDSYDEMIRDYNGPVFNKGTTYFSLWDGNLLKGTIGIITKDVEEKGEVFITSINVLEEDKIVFKKLLKKGIEESIKISPQKMKIGIHSNKKYLIPFVEESDFKGVYEAVILRLKSYDDLNEIETHDEISFENLSEKNKMHFKDVHNEGFLNSPNGAMLTDEQIDEMLQKNGEKPNIVKICYMNDEPVGIYELILKRHVGWIEAIAISSKWQGKGLGKLLLKEAVDNLLNIGATEIKLFVISSNEKAYKLYLKYGFEIEKITSHWFEKDIK